MTTKLNFVISACTTFNCTHTPPAAKASRQQAADGSSALAPLAERAALALQASREQNAAALAALELEDRRQRAAWLKTFLHDRLGIVAEPAAGEFVIPPSQLGIPDALLIKFIPGGGRSECDKFVIVASCPECGMNVHCKINDWNAEQSLVSIALYLENPQAFIANAGHQCEPEPSIPSLARRFWSWFFHGSHANFPTGNPGADTRNSASQLRDALRDFLNE